MAAAARTNQQLDEIHDFATQWGKIVARRAFGEQGPGLELDLSALEQIASAAARGLAEGTLATLLEQQAQLLPAQAPCPACGCVCAVTREPRQLTSQGGTLTYDEPRCHCPACRRDFIPSTGPSASG